MKVVNTDQSFKPVTLVLESQEEVNMVKGLFGAINNVFSKAFGVSDSAVNAVYEGLEYDDRTFIPSVLTHNLR
jgi:phosphotransacetylase